MGGFFPNWWSAAEVTLLTSYMTHNHQPHHDDEDDHQHDDDEDNDHDHDGLKKYTFTIDVFPTPLSPSTTILKQDSQ